ncbi:phenylacetate-CoA oxygenase subunit PaaI [Bacillus sp. ISL-4]|uniref:Phenylacetic acid catabolic protein n=1 Tax=Bacillus sp. ISL-4 TaxID=2819125 RepID=UPI001BECAC18|nr:Phenylacetic acid catabolic protein [Bacillus sp. ISL-4]MBT2667633.1 phenylacetate-CoA oxygenase subunit PaaI [Bacillus sp. ISL-4]MBT2672334.1 phenylacetate-CoA oxygenase subunit PaaI [Streptomyces sp. ISL-14]
MVNSTNGNTELITLIETIADNKFILGDRLVEVGISGPDLEGTLAAIAMAQSELGHARLLYNWGMSLKSGKGSKKEVKVQTGKAFDSIVQIGEWIQLIAGLYTMNTAFNTLITALTSRQKGSEIELQFNKLAREQLEHILYSKNWALKLLNDGGSIPVRFGRAFKLCEQEVITWLKQVENNSVLIENEILPVNSNLVNSYKEALIPRLRDEEIINAR